MIPKIHPDAHVRRIEVVDSVNPGEPLFRQTGPGYIATCSCGWGGKTYGNKNKAASAWGIHAAAARRRERGLR